MDVLGPRLDVREADGSWVARSPDVPGSAVHVTTLIEARLPEPDLRRTADDLLARLLKTGQCRPHTVDGYETGGLDVTRRPYHLIDRQGRSHARRFAFGVPTEGVHWVTAAGARPGWIRSRFRMPMRWREPFYVRRRAKQEGPERQTSGQMLNLQA